MHVVPMKKFMRNGARLAFAGFAAVLVAACGGGGGSEAAAQAPGSPQGPPTVSLSASPNSVSSGGTTMLSWTSSNADSCTASGGWSGARAVNGSAQSPAVTSATTFTLSCNGPGGGAVANATVSISSSASPSVQLSAS